MTKTQKFLITAVIVSLMLSVFSLLMNDNLQVEAASETTDGKTLLNQYPSLPIDPMSYFEGSEGFVSHAEIPTLGGSAEVFWHFIDSTASGYQAFVEFKNDADVVLSITLNVYKLVGAGHYGVNTPMGFKLTNAYLLGEVDGNFNLSHTYYETAETTVPSETSAETTPVVTTETTPVVTTQPSGETVTETTIELTTESVPLQSETTQTSGETIVETTTAMETTTVVMTDPDIPQTGETGAGNGLLIGLILLVMAGGLSAVIYRSRKIKN